MSSRIVIAALLLTGCGGAAFEESDPGIGQAGAAGEPATGGSAGSATGGSGWVTGGAAGTGAAPGGSGGAAAGAAGAPDAGADAVPVPPCSPEDAVPNLPSTITWSYDAKTGPQCSRTVNTPGGTCQVEWFTPEFGDDGRVYLHLSWGDCPSVPGLSGTCGSETDCTFVFGVDFAGYVRLEPAATGYTVRIDNVAANAVASEGTTCWRNGVFAPSYTTSIESAIDGATWSCP